MAVGFFNATTAARKATHKRSCRKERQVSPGGCQRRLQDAEAFSMGQNRIFASKSSIRATHNASIIVS
jgi:hypothetical protein